MAPFRAKSSGGVTGLRRAGDDAFKLTVDYLKQEALEPLKGLGRFLLWGVTGSLAIAVGIVLILVGILRLLQTETGTALTGDWSWVPYFVVGLLGIGVVAAAAWRITAGPGQPQLPRDTGLKSGELTAAGASAVGASAVGGSGLGASGLGGSALGNDTLGNREGSS